MKDGRRKFTEIAEEFNVTPSKVKKHYYKLIEMGVIKKLTAHVDQKKIGYPGHLSVYVNVKFGEVENFMKYVRKIKGATSYHIKLNGKYNVHVLIPLKNMNEIEEKTQKIKDHPTVIHFKSNIWTEVKTFPENLSVLSS